MDLVLAGIAVVCIGLGVLFVFYAQYESDFFAGCMGLILGTVIIIAGIAIWP